MDSYNVFRIVKFAKNKFGFCKFGYKSWYELQKWNPVYKHWYCEAGAIELQRIENFCYFRKIDFKSLPTITKEAGEWHTIDKNKPQ